MPALDKSSIESANKELLIATKDASLERVERALAMGACEAGRSAAFESLKRQWGAKEGFSDREACALALVKAGIRLLRDPAKPCSALHYSLISRAPESVIRALISAGALINEADVFGQTPLHLALLSGRPGVCSALIELGADESVKDDNGASPLSMMSEAPNEEGRMAALRALAQREGRAIAAGLDPSALATKRARL